MRKFLTMFAIWLPLLAYCASVTTDKFYINDFAMSPGEQKEVELNLLSTVDYYSFQVNIYLPEGLTFVFNEDEEDYIVPTDRIPDGRKNGWPYLGDFVEGGDGSLLITAYSPNLVESLAPGDGPVFTFVVQADATFEGGVIECKYSEMTDEAYEAHNGPDTECQVSVVKAMTLAQMVADGKLGSTYEISEPLTCVFITSDGKSIFAKDDNGFALSGQPPYAPSEGQIQFERASSFDQSNWVEIQLDAPVTPDEYETLMGHKISGVRGTLINKDNPTLTTNVPPTGGEFDGYVANWYCPANFVAQESYYLMPPKPQEYANIRWAIYQDEAFYIPEKTENHNRSDLNGAVRAKMALYEGEPLANGTVYELTAIIRAIEPSATPVPRKATPKVTEPSTMYEIYPITSVTDAIITDIESIKAENDEDGLYYNLLGQPVRNPGPGIYLHNGRKVIVR